MHTEVRLGEYLVEIDRNVTREWYAAAEGWSCSCGDCRNFLALARAGRLPEPVLSLLDSLGIPPPTEPPVSPNRILIWASSL